MKHRRVSPPRNRRVALALSAAVLSITAAGGLLSGGGSADEDADVAAALADRAALVDRADRAERATAEPGEPKESPTPKPPAQKVLRYDFQEQPNSYFCGPAATYNALSARGIKVSQYELARRLGTTTYGTKSAFDTTRVLNEMLGEEVYQTREIRGRATPEDMERLQEDVVRAISNGYAVVANVVGGTTDAAGIWRSYPGGHYVTIVGYRDEGRMVKVADPAGIGGDGTYWVSTINMARWMSTRGYSA